MQNMNIKIVLPTSKLIKSLFSKQREMLAQR